MAALTGAALFGGTVTAAAEPVDQTAAVQHTAVVVQQVSPPPSAAGTNEAGALSAGIDLSTAGVTEVRPMALPAFLIWAIFRALVKRYGPTIAKEILCAVYGVC